MKKIIYTLALFLAIGAFQSANAQVIQTGATTESLNDNGVSLRQNINRPITQLIVNGKSAVMLVYDTANFIVANFERNEMNPLDEKWVVVKGMSLIIDDPDGNALYIVHLKKDELQVVKNNSTTPILYVEVYDNHTTALQGGEQGESTGNLAVQQQLDEARQQLAEARRELSRALSRHYGERIEVVYDTMTAGNTDSLIYLEPINDFIDPMENPGDSTRSTIREILPKHYYYDWEDRSGASFLWGFNNWGSNWYNGLGKMDGVYELRTSFSSWQIELTYAVIMTRNFYLDLGIGYESDIYKFTAPLVGMNPNGILQDDYLTSLNSNYNNLTINNQLFTSTHLEDWSSTIVTRYFSLPIDFVFRFNNDFKIGLTAIPALSFSSSHTGLKHEIDTKELVYQDVQNISQFINPYKLDLRLTLRYDHFGIFAQVTTNSLFTEKDVYPFKIGFIIK